MTPNEGFAELIRAGMKRAAEHCRDRGSHWPEALISARARAPVPLLHMGYRFGKTVETTT